MGHGWRTSWIAPARTFAGRTTQIVVGVIGIDDGDQVAMRIGEDVEPVILPTQAASELIVNIRAAVTEKLRRNGGNVVGIQGFSNSGAGWSRPDPRPKPESEPPAGLEPKPEKENNTDADR